MFKSRQQLFFIAQIWLIYAVFGKWQLLQVIKSKQKGNQNNKLPQK